MWEPAIQPQPMIATRIFLLVSIVTSSFEVKVFSPAIDLSAMFLYLF